LEATNGKLRLVLRSTKVLARIEDLESNSVLSNSLLAWNGQVFGTRRRVMFYEYVFDERQTQALREARELTRKTGLILEVTDLTRQNALKRILISGMSRIGGQARLRGGSKPSLVAADSSGCVRPLACQP